MMSSSLEVEERRLVIAVDYGTTYTGVAIATPVGFRASLDEIDIVQDWGPGMENHKKIPSVISFSRIERRNGQHLQQQWGADLSPEAVAMVHTKLQLDVDECSAELDLVLQALDGMRNLDFRYIKASNGEPKYTRKGPEEIVTAYLTKVFAYLLRAVESFTDELRNKIPVDIVATIPAGWGYRAKNSIFRALSDAGFNKYSFPHLRDVLMVSEPEAAAIYTARYLKESYGADFLRKGECFVLCDAGGGTVDVVSYRVKQLLPTFEIEAVTMPTSAKCGSIFINLAFKRWLRDLIGPRRYQELDSGQLVNTITSHDAEGKSMRELMKNFDIFKRRFSKGHRDIKLDLPSPFENLNMNSNAGSVVGGQITINARIMESFFDICGDQIVALIQDQLEQLEFVRQTHLRNVMLVGGFAESPYLKETIEESLLLRGLELRIPDTSWTAVVRGAAIFGIEKSNNGRLSSMSPCIRSYGVAVNAAFSAVSHKLGDYVLDPLTKTAIAKGQLKWLVRKGDLILSDEPKKAEQSFTIQFTETGSRRGNIPIYSYDEDDLPERLSNSQNDLTKFHDVHYDLKDIPLQAFQFSSVTTTSPPFYTAYLTLVITVARQTLLVELLLDNLNKKVIYSEGIVEPPQGYEDFRE